MDQNINRIFHGGCITPIGIHDLFINPASINPLMVTIATNFLFLGKNSNLVQVFLIPLDYVTMVFALWNFTVVGLVSIFWKGPLWLQQVYLTVMSSLMVSVIIQDTVAHSYLGIFINRARAVDNMDPTGIACNMG